MYEAKVKFESLEIKRSLYIDLYFTIIERRERKKKKIDCKTITTQIFMAKCNEICRKFFRFVEIN